MSNRAKIEELLVEANAAGLEGLGWLSQFPIETLAREYNGIGPEWAGSDARDWSTHKFHIFEAAALIHDLRNFVSDGSDDGFIFANREFLTNCLKLANRAYPWYSWRRYRARAVAFALYEFVSGAGGRIAWQQCAARNVAKLNVEKLRSSQPSNLSTSQPFNLSTPLPARASANSSPIEDQRNNSTP